MIVTIYRTAHINDLMDAITLVSDQLHVPRNLVHAHVAIGYIEKHFKQGIYEGWEGFAAMRKADRLTEARNKERTS